MKVRYLGKEYETVEDGGLILSADGKKLFGKVGQPLLCGEEITEEVTEEVTEEAPQDESA